MEEKKQIYEVLEERAFKELEEYEQAMLQKEPCEIYDACYDIVFRKRLLEYIQDELQLDFEENEVECLRNVSPLIEALCDTAQVHTELYDHPSDDLKEVFIDLINDSKEE